MPAGRPTIIDAFPFFNELDVLEFRLALLDRVVDKFILVEGTKTFTGRDKPLYFEESRARYAQFAHKIVHVVIDDYPETEDTWERQHFQRNAIRRGLNEDDRDALLLITDVDELVDPDVLVTSAQMLTPDVRVVRYLLRLFYFFANYQNVLGEGSEWPGPFLIRVSSLDDVPSLSKMRMAMMTEHWDPLLPVPPSRPTVALAGWHFSYLGDNERLHAKLRSISGFKPEDVIAQLSIPSLIQDRRGPYDDDYPLNVWAFVDPDTLELPDVLLENANFNRCIHNEIDSYEDVFARCKESTFQLRCAHAKRVQRLRKKIEDARERRLFKRIKRLLGGTRADEVADDQGSSLLAHIRPQSGAV